VKCPFLTVHILVPKINGIILIVLQVGLDRIVMKIE